MSEWLTPAQLAARCHVSVSHASHAAKRRGLESQGHSHNRRYLWPDDVPQPSPGHERNLGQETPAPKTADSYPRQVPAPVAFDDGAPYDGKIRRVAFLADVHIPEHDTFAARAALKWVSRNEPDIVILGGDILELASCSQHGGNMALTPMLTEELEAGNKFLDEVRLAAGKNAELHYLMGNHETRLIRMVDALAPTLAGALHLPELLHLADRGIPWLPYKHVLAPYGSKLGFTHGTDTVDHHAKKHLDRYGTSLMYGHTHRMQSYTKGFYGNRLRGAFGVPCLRGLEVEWTNGPNGWSQGFGLAHLFDDGHFTATTMLMDRQRFVEGGVLYDGRA